MSSRPALTVRAVLLVLAASLVAALVASPAAGQDYRLRLSNEGGGDLGLTIEPVGPVGPPPSTWNLYRGNLADVALYAQVGDPDGRCDLDGSVSQFTLAGELTTPGNFYYLLTSVEGGMESDLGSDGLGGARPNNFPCPIPCGTDLVDVTQVRRTEGVIIDEDGTLYYSQSGGGALDGAVGRRTPAGVITDRWVTLPGSGTVWGVVVRADGMVFAAAPGTAVFAIDSTAMAPTATMLYPTGPTDPPVGAANGLTIGPDDAVYYGDFSGGRVHRLTDAGARTEVTTSPIPNANGLLFDDDGTLLVLAYGNAQVWRLTLDASMVEVSRVLDFDFGVGALDGIAKDELGRYYLTDNAFGRLLRFDGAWGNQEVLATGIGAAANITFGKGSLGCMDVYVASSGDLGYFAGDAAGRP